MTQRGMQDTSQLSAVLTDGHDLRRLAKELRLPPNAALSRNYKSKRHGELPPSALHQAWRYGGVLQSDAEAHALEDLEALMDWCERQSS